MEFGMRQGADVSKEFSTTKLTCLLGELLLLSLFPSLLEWWKLLNGCRNEHCVILSGVSVITAVRVQRQIHIVVGSGSFHDIDAV